MKDCPLCQGTGWLAGAQEWTPERMRNGTPYKSVRCACRTVDRIADKVLAYRVPARTKKAKKRARKRRQIRRESCI